jgi:hypothetical protein
MDYKLKRAALSSITEEEVHVGTIRLLPKQQQIPDEFWDGNVYTRTATSLYFNERPEAGEFIFRPGFQDADARADMLRCVRAHLRSMETEHEHKIAGVGYMISKICTVAPSRMVPGRRLNKVERRKSGTAGDRAKEDGPLN